MSHGCVLPPGRLTDPQQFVTFTFDGRPIRAQAGQSVGAALYAAGVRTFSRSFKYHRPRGLLCVSGDCPNCLMQVDGRPNVRTCIEPARSGQVVLHQNAWPSLNWDLLRIFDYVDWLLPVGFYYKRFHKPRWLWPIFEPVVRRIAGLGKIDVAAVPEAGAEVEHLHAEVCIVGGGPAGLAAASVAAQAGANVLLLERLPHLGGHAVFERGTQPDFEAYAAQVAKQPGIRVLCNTTAFGLYEGNLLGAFQEDRFLKIRAPQIIVCTGGRERPFVFHNNDLPGVFLSRGVLRLAGLYGVRAGRRAVVLTDNDEGAFVARRIKGLGIEVAAVVDCRPGAGMRASVYVERFSALQLPGAVVIEAGGANHLTGVRVAQVDEAGTIDRASVQQIACDLLCMVPRLEPANELLRQAGVRFRYANGGWRPEGELPGVAAAGIVAGTIPFRAQQSEGRLRGAEAARALGHKVPDWDEYRRAWESTEKASTAPPGPGIFPQMETGHRKRFICLCEDVTEKDLGHAMDEGFDHIETLKRYATVNMGPCQGKMCGQNAIEVCGRLAGRDINTIGATTSRPPVVPVDLCVLAADQRHVVRRTPLHHWHEAAGATWTDAGLWKRPERYGDAVAEVRAVRNGVGLIDVSTLGKIELVGPDAAELLERICVNKWTDLKVGKVRYGVMCTEEGILFDDGVGARRERDRMYLTATTGNAEAVFQWLEMWRATWGSNVTILNRTAAMAAMNLAGPRARDLLSRLTRLDLSPAAFPYLSMREGDVAGVPCLLLRIGFVGELGYEIHCASALAGHLWEAIIAAGKVFGLKPFGVEAQRVLRLEKGHLIIGVDTDASSHPLEAGLEGLVRFDKPLFHGRASLLRLKARGPRSRLVGFRVPDAVRLPYDLRVLEGCQVMEAGRPVGRVTSARRSPSLESAIGLAWVPAAKTNPGAVFLIRSQGRDLSAEVAAIPFYDPEMKRLKS